MLFSRTAEPQLRNLGALAVSRVQVGHREQLKALVLQLPTIPPPSVPTSTTNFSAVQSDVRAGADLSGDQ